MRFVYVTETTWTGAVPASCMYVKAWVKDSEYISCRDMLSTSQ